MTSPGGFVSSVAGGGARFGRDGTLLFDAAAPFEAGDFRLVGLGAAQWDTDHEHAQSILICDTLLARSDIGKPVTVGLSAYLAVRWCGLDTGRWCRAAGEGRERDQWQKSLHSGLSPRMIYAPFVAREDPSAKTTNSDRSKSGQHFWPPAKYPVDGQPTIVATLVYSRRWRIGLLKREQLEITAYHEAGHAVMALACGFIVNELSIQSSAQRRGYVAWSVVDPDSDLSRKKSILVLASGLAADYLHWQMVGGAEHDDPEGYFNDRRQAQAILDVLNQDAGAFECYLAVAVNILGDPDVWQWVIGFAELMLDGATTINGPELLHRAAKNCPKISGDVITLLDYEIARAVASSTAG